MATQHLRQATKDAADTVTEAVSDGVDTMSDALGDAKDAVVDTAKDIQADRDLHHHTVDTMQDSLERRSAEREQTGGTGS